MLALGVSVLLLTLLAVGWGGRRLLRRPVTTLLQAIERWRRGELSARARLKGAPREIAVLGQAFDSMADDLQAQQEQLGEAEARYRSIVDTAVDAMVVIDERGIIQSFNPAASRIFGYAAPEVVGRNVAMLMPEPDRSAHDGYLRHYLETGERRIIGIGREVEGRRQDGAIFPLELAIAEWRVSGERYFTGIMRDITERREAQRRFRESHQLLTTIVESIPDPVYAKDDTGRYLLANTATCALLGVEPAELLGARDRDFLPPEIVERIEAAERRVLRTGEIGVEEEDIAGRTRGRRTYLSTKAPLRNGSGRTVGLVGVSLDITHRKRAEEGLRAAKAEAERANLAKSKFLAAASHDLRQPVQSLVLFMSLLKERLDGSTGEPPAAVLDSMQQALGGRARQTGAVKALGSMEQALDGLRMLLDSLLDVSRLDAGLVVAHPAVVPLGPLLERLAAEYRPRVAAKGLRLRMVGTDAAVRTDPALLERILRNLLENSLRYTERGGILVGCRRHGDRLRLEVVDTGVGIAPEKIDEIFEEFYQGHNPERDRTKGLGLGLAVVRRLGRLLGHEIEVRSAPGRGSAFAIVRCASTRPGTNSP
jgi:PAS domain S-box-containing protein